MNALWKWTHESKDLSTPQGVDPVGGELVNPVARPQGVEKQIKRKGNKYMRRKIIWIILSLLMVLSLVLVSCSTKTTSTTTPTSTLTTTPTTKATSTPITTPTGSPTAAPTTGGNWWDYHGVPEYGDKLYLQTNKDIEGFDVYLGGSGELLSLYNQQLDMRSWTVDRKIWPHNIQYAPAEYKSGQLAESWEQPDAQTVIFHIRKGVYWQDIPPVNGRELTAYDIEWNYHRLLGLGSGFTKPCPFRGTTEYGMVKSVTATDKYTVVIKSKYPTLAMMDSLLDTTSCNQIAAREVVEKWGDANDWRHAIGTGPFILKDYVSGSSLTFIKNPNYWGYDERHPENKLPYVDGVSLMIIPDPATTMAAMRTGKIDLVENINWMQAAILAQTNPEIKQARLPNNGFCLHIRDDKTPFTDIRVREALQMAIDLPTIAKTYYGGTVEGIPYPLFGPCLPGYYFPYDEWPQDLKDKYAYNPEGAKKLLAEAGYPKGFKTNCVASSSGVATDLDLAQIAKAYFKDIGVDMEIKVMDYTSWRSFTRDKKAHDQMVLDNRSALTYPPLTTISQRYSTQISGLDCTHDPVYDKMVDYIGTVVDPAEQKRLMQACDRYAVEHFWQVVFPETVSANLYWPWLKGYSGESMPYNYGVYCARWWIDQTLKKSMGH